MQRSRRRGKIEDPTVRELDNLIPGLAIASNTPRFLAEKLDKSTNQMFYDPGIHGRVVIVGRKYMLPSFASPTKQVGFVSQPELYYHMKDLVAWAP